MKYSYAVAALGAAAVTASPVVKRAAITDADILNYALTLEHLEDKFYREGLANYTQADFVAAGFADPFYQNLKEISSDETTHVSFLTSALSAAGATPVAECTYDFPSTDAASFVAVASIFEGVGVSAYLGAAASIMDKTYLTAAGSILTVEARHSSYIRASNKANPVPQPFDDPLLLDEVYTLVAPFIVSCPASNPPLPAKPFPVLDVSGNATNLTAGAELTMTVPAGFNVTGDLYAAFLTGITVETVPYKVNQSVTIPATVASTGMTYVVISTSNTAASDNTTVAGPAILMFSAYNMPSTNTTANMSASMTASSTSASTTASAMSKNLNSTSAAEKTASSVLAASFAMIVGMMVFG